MAVQFHPQAKQRMAERGATEPEVVAAVQEGERFQAKLGRMGFRRNFVFEKAGAAGSTEQNRGKLMLFARIRTGW